MAAKSEAVLRDRGYQIFPWMTGWSDYLGIKARRCRNRASVRLHASARDHYHLFRPELVFFRSSLSPKNQLQRYADEELSEEFPWSPPLYSEWRRPKPNAGRIDVLERRSWAS